MSHYDPLKRLENVLSGTFNAAAQTFSTVMTYSPLSLFQNPAHPIHRNAAPASKFTGGRQYLDPVNLHQFNIPTWLLLVKAEGPAHGLGKLADHIHLTQRQGQYSASVDDPAVLRQIAALREDKRLTGQLARGYLDHHKHVFPIVTMAGANSTPDPALAQDQRALMTLGFNLGIRKPDGIRGPLTDAALKEFAAMHHPPLQGSQVHAQLQSAEQQAKADSAKYSNGILEISPPVAFSVRNASVATGMDYKALMQTALRESSFDPQAQPISPGHWDKHHHFIPGKPGGALGLFQFEPTTWLSEIQMNGAKYGLGHLASQVKGDASDADIADPAVRKYALSLRTDPRYNALLGAELARENQSIVAAHHPDLKNDPAAWYSVHFLGAGVAGDYLSALKHNPDAPAANSLPPAAVKNNHNVFYDGAEALSNLEVFQRMKRSFSGHAFDQPAPLSAGNHPQHKGGAKPS